MLDCDVVTYFPVKHLGGSFSTQPISVAYFGYSHWRRDRGKELLTRAQKSKPPWIQDDSWDPDDDRELRPRDDYRWFWRDGEFTGDRVNDVHLTIAEKHMARSRNVHTETDR